MMRPNLDPHRQAIEELRAVADDPRCTADRAADAALGTMRFEVATYGWRGWQKLGRGMVLLDLRPEAEALLSYFPRAMFDEYDRGPDPELYTPLLQALDDYDPPGEFVVSVFVHGLVRVYRLDYFAHGQKYAPLVPFVSVER